MPSKVLIKMIKFQITLIKFWPSNVHPLCECHTVLYSTNKSLPHLLLLMSFPTIYGEGVLQTGLLRHHFWLAVREKSGRRCKELKEEGGLNSAPHLDLVLTHQASI
jgi:hypothetical protein